MAHPLTTEAMIKRYSEILQLLLEKQEEIYGKLFIEIVPDAQELAEQLKEKSNREIKKLQQTLQNQRSTTVYTSRAITDKRSGNSASRFRN